MSDRARGRGLLAVGLSAPAALAVGLLGAGLLGVALPGLAARGVPLPRAGAQDATPRVEGEFGLWARFDGDSLRVSWLTPDSVPGILEVSAGSAPSDRERFETPAGRSHTAAFRAPERGELLLDYGALEDPEDRHRTWLYLESREGEEPAPIAVTGVDSLYVIGDIHGEYANLVNLLRTAGLIDEDRRWSGGRSHLAVVGDMMSRGRDVTAVLWLLYRLEREAEAADGRVHIILGNHEIMVWLDDLRYVQPKERRIAEAHGVGYDRMFDPRQSVLGRWLAAKPAVLRIDDVLLAHGGISADYLDYTVQSHRDSLAAFMAEDLFYYWADTTVAVVMDSAAFERRVDFFWDDRSVFWYRDYARAETDSARADTDSARADTDSARADADYAPADTLAAEPRPDPGAELESVLREFDSEVHVVGHTPVPTITEAFGGSLVLVNTIDFATELLLLVREGEGHQRYRIRIWGEPEPL